MLRLTVAGVRARLGPRVRNISAQQPALTLRPRHTVPRLLAGGRDAKSTRTGRPAADDCLLVRGQRDPRFVSAGLGLRLRPPHTLRFQVRARPVSLKTIQVIRNYPHPTRWLGPPAYHVGTDALMAAPIFLAPLIALLKSSVVVKGLSSIYIFFKTSVLSKAFASLVPFLKSGTVVKSISVVSQVTLSLVASLRLYARKVLHWWHGYDHIDKMKAQQAPGTRTPHRRHFRRTKIVLTCLPIALLCIAVLASLERTPVWGRWRVIMMSADEEARLVEEFLRPGSPPGAHVDATAPRDWVAILRAAGGEDAGPPGTLMGLRVVDPRTDWRARWVASVFAQLEDGVRHLNLTSENAEAGCNVLDVGEARFVAPPAEYPLTVRPALLKYHGHSENENPEGPLLTRYACLVVESPVCNAFSVGFGPALKSEPCRNEEAPGVVVVYTGLIDEILRGRNDSAGVEPSNALPDRPAPTGIFGIFQKTANHRPVSTTFIPTKYETDQLASMLAHELGHLLLSHSLETLASSDMYELLGTLATDLVRAVLYPLTAILGPTFNDWFGKQVRTNSALGLGVTSSCESRKAEVEADLVGLRILLGAGIDPRVARDVWGPDGLFARAERREEEEREREEKERETGAQHGGSAGAGVGGDASEGDESWLDRNGFTRSHPVNEVRHRRIAEELERWEALGRAMAEEKSERGGELGLELELGPRVDGVV
ncbi:hypothetical protein M0805_004471 [Coniferiporia weirii]|nr:hypothetical protein M0805_004471 [Coniferiporia weirii]